jgi:hypothetical protein
VIGFFNASKLLKIISIICKIFQVLTCVISFRTTKRKQKFVNEIGSAFEDILRSTQRSLLNDQLVEELYGEIRNFCFTIGNKT